MRLKTTKRLLEERDCSIEDCPNPAKAILHMKPYCSQHYFFVNTKEKLIRRAKKELIKNEN